MTHSEHVRRIIKSGVCLLTLASCAVLISRGAVRLVAAALPVASHAAPARPPESPTSGRALAEAVLARNSFDAQTGPLPWDGAVIAPLPPVAANSLDLDGELPACDGDMRLVAAMVVPREPELSFASIAEAGQTLLYKPGMQVSGREVVGIREQRVFLRGASAATCQLNMFTPAAAPASSVPAPSIATRESGDARITQQGESSFRIARSLFEESVSGESMMRSARVVPVREGERITGLKLAGLRRGSTLAQLGLQNGDVLKSINGVDLTSPDRALEAYARLREANHFSLTLSRAGGTRSFEYTIE